MEWYHYFGGFWAGMFLANFVPHFVKGICGDSFPTPFARPPGQGLSSPTINVAWALFNLLIGFFLFRFAGVSMQDNLSLIIFFAGVACISIAMSIRFSAKHKA
jgi:hypothetical protein